MINADDLQTVAEIQSRRRSALAQTLQNHADPAEAEADATTSDDVAILESIRRRLPKDVRQVIEVYTETLLDYHRGDRCPLCKMTPRQAAVYGFDCQQECGEILNAEVEVFSVPAEMFAEDETAEAKLRKFLRGEEGGSSGSVGNA